MYAIVETGGKQYRIQEGDLLKVESLGIAEGESLVLDKVLFVGRDDEISVGTPYVEGASVSASVVTNGKDRKVLYSSQEQEELPPHERSQAALHGERIVPSIREPEI